MTRRGVWIVGALAVVGAGTFACSSNTATTGTLNFTVAESLLVLFEPDASIGFALLSSGTGNCAAIQSGVNLLPPQVGNIEYVIVPLGNFDADGGSLPLGAGTYNIIDPYTGSFSPPGLIANYWGVSVDTSCNSNLTWGSSGTVTLTPFSDAPDGSSGYAFSTVLNTNTQLTGTYTLTTCVADLNVPGLPAGTCVQCVANDGGACTIPCTAATDGGVCAEP